MPFGQQSNPMNGGVPQYTPIAHRSGVVAADVLAVPTTSAASAVAGGSCTANTYHTSVVGVNAYGRTTPSVDRQATTATTNLTVRMPITQLTGAVSYDIYCSIDASPKWVGRITEAQRLSGIKLTAVGTTGAGGTANAVDVEVPGTGLVGATTAAVNTAYTIPATGTAIDCSGYQYCDFEILASMTGDAVALAVNLLILVQNSRRSGYAMNTTTPVALTFGGVTATYQPLIQRYRAEVRGSAAVWCLVQSIAGTGASLDIDATPC